MARPKTRNSGEFRGELNYRAKRIANLKAARENLEAGVGLTAHLSTGRRVPFPELIGTTQAQKRDFEYRKLRRIAGAGAFKELPITRKGAINQRISVLEEIRTVEHLLEKDGYTTEEIEKILAERLPASAQHMLRKDARGELHSALLELGEKMGNYWEDVRRIARLEKRTGR